MYSLGLHKKIRGRPLILKGLELSSQGFKGKCPWDVRIRDYLFNSFFVSIVSGTLCYFLVYVVTIAPLSTFPCRPWLYISTSYTLSVGSLLHRHSWLIFAMTNFKFWQNDVYSVVFLYFINIQLIVFQTLTKDSENGWGSGKGQKSESGFWSKRAEEHHLLAK